MYTQVRGGSIEGGGTNKPFARPFICFPFPPRISEIGEARIWAGNPSPANRASDEPN